MFSPSVKVTNLYIIYCSSSSRAVSSLSTITTSRLSNRNCFNKRCQKIKLTSYLRPVSLQLQMLPASQLPPFTPRLVNLLAFCQLSDVVYSFY